MIAGLDLSRLAKSKERGGKIIAQCPACAANGADNSGDHLVIFDAGRGPFACVAFPGDKEHRRQIAVAVGVSDDGARRRSIIVPPRRSAPPAPRLLQLPPLRIPTVGELAQLADQRGLMAFAGLERATRAGMLRFASMTDQGESVIAWILVDSANRCAQARRLDGKPWRGIGDVKAKTLPGSQASWPIGCADIGSRPFVAMCEGGPDTLAAWTLVWWHGKSAEIAPVCVCGAGNSLAADALPFFAGKGIWLFPHRDPAGERAQAKWTTELTAAGAAWVKPFDLTPHKDLNDWLIAAAIDFEGNE